MYSIVVVEPLAKVEPDGGPCVWPMPTPRQLSFAVEGVHETTALHSPVSLLTEMLHGPSWITGGECCLPSTRRLGQQALDEFTDVLDRERLIAVHIRASAVGRVWRIVEVNQAANKAGDVAAVTDGVAVGVALTRQTRRHARVQVFAAGLRIACIDRTGIAIVAVMRHMRAASLRVATIIRAGVVIVAVDRDVDALSGQWIT